MNSSEEEIYYSVFDLLPVSAVLVNEAGRVVKANQRFLSFSEYSFEQLKAFPSLPCFRLGGRAPIEWSADIQGEIEFVTKAGDKKSCLVWVSRVSAKSSLLSIVFFPAECLDEGIKHSSKLESLGTLAGGIAHDLNNILTGILGHVSFLRLSLGQDGTHSESVAAIEEGGRRAASLTEQILNFARDEDVVPDSVNFSQIVAAAIRLIQGALPKNIRLSASGLDSDIFVMGDEGRLSQLCINLIVNARDALPNGGEVCVSLSRAIMEESSESSLSGSYVCLKIQDNGMGMSPDVKTRIFDRFYTTKRGTDGTGLGLATVVSIVERAGGAIEVDTELGKGSLFTVYIPEYVDSRVRGGEGESSALPQGNERILVIDDEEMVRTVIQRSLEHLGYRVETAVNGPDALSRYRHNAASYQLVILDMMMPKMAGEEVFQRLKELDEGVKVLIVSGYSSGDRAQGVLDSGGMGFIQKPFAVEDLAREVRRCLDTYE